MSIVSRITPDSQEFIAPTPATSNTGEFFSGQHLRTLPLDDSINAEMELAEAQRAALEETRNAEMTRDLAEIDVERAMQIVTDEQRLSLDERSALATLKCEPLNAVLFAAAKSKYPARRRAAMIEVITRLQRGESA